MRVLAFNVSSCRSGVERVVEVIRASDPDVALLNEISRGQAKEVAEALTCHLVFGATLRFRRYGNAILMRGRPGRRLHKRFSRTRKLERRGYVGTVRSDGSLVVATHLGTRGDERTRHAAQLLRAVEAYDRVVIGGDFNESPDAAAVRVLADRFTDAFAVAGEGSGETFPANAPLHRTDYVFCSRTLTPRRAAVVPVIASDHLAVVADVD